MRTGPYFLSLLVLAASSHAYAESPMFPPAEMIGTWTNTVEVFGPFKVQPYPSQAPEDHQTVTVTINADGTVSGKIGAAVFKNCSVSRNRGWLGKNLNVKTDYIIQGGTLEGKVTPKDPGTNSKFTIPFNLEKGTLKGTIMLLPKYPLTRPLDLKKAVPKPAT
jgi:hypothetical protein